MRTHDTVAVSAVAAALLLMSGSVSNDEQKAEAKKMMASAKLLFRNVMKMAWNLIRNSGSINVDWLCGWHVCATRPSYATMHDDDDGMRAQTCVGEQA